MRRACAAAALIVAAVCPGVASAGPAHRHLRPFSELAPDTVRARPDDSQTDPAGTHKWTGPEALNSPSCTAHFCVHFTSVGTDASTKSYADAMASLLENQVYPCESTSTPNACAGSAGLGWAGPPSDQGIGGSDAVDVYIQDLYSTEKVYGYTALDPGQDQNPLVPHYSYMVLDKDYTRYGDGSPAAGTAAEDVTAAHEYNHVLQNGYDYLEDPWMFESTAVWMEKKVFPTTTDYVNYVSSWASNTKQPLTQFSDSNLKPYGSAVWNHWLDHRYGAAVVRSAWEQSTAVADFAPSAYDAAIRAAGGAGFSDEFDRFSAAVAEWNAPGAGFPDHYPDVPRDGTLPVGSQTDPFSLPHTTFAFLDVPVPQDAPRTIRLTATLPAGIAGGLALVGRTGSDPNGGSVVTNVVPVESGGTAAVGLDDPGQFGRITAVVVNADPAQAGFDAQADDYVFTHDASGVQAAVAEPGAPIPTTGAATAIGDHSATINAAVDPHLIDTSWTIDYGRSSAYGLKTPAQTVPASTVGAAPVVVTIRDLRANSIYHYRVLATNSGGAAAGRDVFFRTLHDVTPPSLLVKAKPQRLSAVRRHGLVYRLRCSERCAGQARIVSPRKLARRLGLPALLGKGGVGLRPRTNTTVLRVRMTRTARTLLAHPRRLRVTLELVVADAAHNRAHAKRRVTLLPR